MKLESILAVSSQVLIERGLTGEDQSLYQLQVQDFLPHIHHGLILGQREALEKDETYRQLLPYVVLTKQFGDTLKFFAYRRGKGVGEARLSGNVSIGVGGHIDMADIVADSSILNAMGTVVRSVQRELEEEIDFSTTVEGADSDIRFNSIGAIVDNSNSVGKVHLGLAFTALLSENTEAKCAEEELETLGWFTAAELLDSGLPLENWTQILCLHLAEAEEA